MKVDPVETYLANLPNAVGETVAAIRDRYNRLSAEAIAKPTWLQTGGLVSDTVEWRRFMDSQPQRIQRACAHEEKRGWEARDMMEPLRGTAGTRTHAECLIGSLISLAQPWEREFALPKLLYRPFPPQENYFRDHAGWYVRVLGCFDFETGMPRHFKVDTTRPLLHQLPRDFFLNTRESWHWYSTKLEGEDWLPKLLDEEHAQEAAWLRSAVLKHLGIIPPALKELRKPTQIIRLCTYYLEQNVS